MKFKTLYGKDSKGGLKLWEVFTNENAINVRHGKVGGKIQTKVTYADAKNIGKANATTPEQQAEIEAEAKWVKQKKKGYFETKEEALEYVDRMPMKAQNYNDYKDRIQYPCIVQPKLNGLRILLDEDGKAQSKQGEEYKLPDHWKDTIRRVYTGLVKYGLDGEVFAGYQKQGGLSLQQINAAFKKPNENTHKLKFYVYDAPISDIPAGARNEYLMWLDYELSNTPCEIVIVDSVMVYNEEQADELYRKWLEDGAEGMVYRNLAGEYEFGKRSYNLIKRKPRQTSEALVIRVARDKNGDGVLTCQLQNGVEFECLMRKDSHDTINYRKVENALWLIGTYIEFEYEELSDAGVPTKPVGVGLREVDPATFEPKE